MLFKQASTQAILLLSEPTVRGCKGHSASLTDLSQDVVLHLLLAQCLNVLLIAL